MDPSTCSGGTEACLGGEPRIFSGEASIRVPGKWAYMISAISCDVRVKATPGLAYTYLRTCVTWCSRKGVFGRKVSKALWRRFGVWKHYFAVTIF